MKNSIINRLNYYLGHSYTAKRSLYQKIAENVRYAKGELLDVGCGEKPYYKLFKPYIDKYVGFDFGQTAGKRIKHADVIGDALNLPFCNNSFDTVLSTEVLEHVPTPSKMLSEIFRVLKPGGNLILTTPFFWPLHEEPYDYFRYTSHGLTHLAKENGFKVLKLEKTAGFFATCGQILSYGLFSQFGIKRKFIIKFLLVLLCFSIQKIFNLLDLLNKKRGGALGHILIASKPKFIKKH